MSDLLREIVGRIEQHPSRALPFHEFMRLALYHPKWGYYRNPKTKLGKRGDFFTSAHAGDVFGRVLARLFLRMMRVTGRTRDWTVVDMGAGDGRIAAQFAGGLLESGGWPQGVTLWLVDTSPVHRELQRQAMDNIPVPWRQAASLREIPRTPLSFVYGNELVDALPVHRIKKERGALFESFVTLKESKGELQEVWLPLSPESPDDDLVPLLCRMDDGQTLEWQPDARKWLEETAAWIREGYLLTVDYGGGTEDLLARPDGTVRGFSGHRVIGDVLQNPGEIDLTAHVNFDLLERWGENAGLRTLAREPQSRFLIRAGAMELMPVSAARDPFSPEARRVRALLQLIHPDAMGERFWALLQSKGLPDPLIGDPRENEKT